MGDAELVIELPGVGRASQSLLKNLFAVGVALLAVEHLAEHDVGIDVIRIAFASLLQSGLGAGQVVLRFQNRGQIRLGPGVARVLLDRSLKMGLGSIEVLGGEIAGCLLILFLRILRSKGVRARFPSPPSATAFRKGLRLT